MRLLFDTITAMRKRSWTENQLIQAVKGSSIYRQVLAKLKLREAGGNYEQIKKYIKEYKLNVKHFKGRTWNKGLKGIGKPRIPLEKILVKNNYFQSFKLKKRLFTANLKPRYCEKCHWAEQTSDGYLPLELDHINGDRHDNRLENLRILCPNCHSLTKNHRGRKNKK
ncbi:HNH endonuclease [Patescibacteria group bacterium]|nr:HNH endonuclease [Patescibacteria group bacterium]